MLSPDEESRSDWSQIRSFSPDQLKENIQNVSVVFYVDSFTLAHPVNVETWSWKNTIIIANKFDNLNDFLESFHQIFNLGVHFEYA